MINIPHGEILALQKMLEDSSKNSGILRHQLSKIESYEYENTGVGSYITFKINASAERLEGYPTFKIDGVTGIAKCVPDGMGFILYIERGAIAMLECFTYGDKLPDRLTELELRFR